MFGREQRGATFLGMVVIFAIVGFALYAGIRLFPLYMEYMAVARAMTQTAKESGESVQSIKVALDRRWTIEDIHTINSTDVEIKKAGKGLTLSVSYRAEAPFVGNVSLVADFDKTVAVGSDDPTS